MNEKMTFWSWLQKNWPGSKKALPLIAGFCLALILLAIIMLVSGFKFLYPPLAKDIGHIKEDLKEVKEGQKERQTDFVKLSKDIGHIKEQLSNLAENSKEEFTRVNDHITSLYEKSGGSKNLIADIKELKVASSRQLASIKSNKANIKKLSAKKEKYPRGPDSVKDTDVNELKTEIEGLKADLKGGQDKLEKKIDRLLEKRD